MEVNNSNIQEAITNQIQVKAKTKETSGQEKGSFKVPINEEEKKSFKETYEDTIKDGSSPEAHKEPDELQSEILSIMNTLSSMMDISGIKAQLVTGDTGDKETVNKITFEIQKLLSEIKEYSDLPNDEKSKISGKILEEIKGEFIHELPQKFTFSKINYTMINDKKFVSTSDKESVKESIKETLHEDDSLVNVIKAEIKGKVNGVSEDKKGSKNEEQNINIKNQIFVKDIKASEPKGKIAIAPENINIIKSELEKNDINVGAASSKEEKLLKDLAAPKDKTNGLEVSVTTNKDTDGKIQKVTMFSSILNNIKNDNISVAEKSMFVSKDNMVKDIIKTVKYMELNNIKNMTVKIMPKELGEVVIKLTMEAGVMKANLTVNNKEAYNILNSNLSEFNSKLNNQDIKIQNFSIDIYKDSTFFSNESGRDDSRQQKSNNGHIASSALEDDENINNEEDLLSRVNILA